MLDQKRIYKQVVLASHFNCFSLSPFCLTTIQVVAPLATCSFFSSQIPLSNRTKNISTVPFQTPALFFSIQSPTWQTRKESNNIYALETESNTAPIRGKQIFFLLTTRCQKPSASKRGRNQQQINTFLSFSLKIISKLYVYFFILSEVQTWK